MAITLPDLVKQPLARWLSACAKLNSPDPDILKWLKRGGNYLAAVRIHGKPFFLRALIGKGSHFHIDVMAPGTFDNENSKKVSQKELQEEISVATGQKVAVFSKGVFFVPIGNVPAAFGQLLEPTKVSDVTIRMESGSFAVAGAPIARVKWGLRNEHKEVWIELETKKTVRTVDESYLEHMWELIEPAFSTFFKANGSTI